MKKLFIIDGAAGTGKTDMINYIRTKGKGSKRSFIHILAKYTTRKKRLEEIERNTAIDLNHITEDEFDTLLEREDFLEYEYGGFRYGFFSKDLDDALEKYTNVFIILRSYDLAHDLIERYPKIKTILVFIYADKFNVIKRLEDEGYEEDSVNFRINRINTAWDDYLKHSYKYQEVLINNSSKTDYKRLIDWLIEKHENQPKNTIVITEKEKFPLIRPLIGYKDKIEQKLLNYSFEKNVFLMMKYRKNNEKIFRFIERNLEIHGFNCVRADQTEWDITQNVYNPIAVLYCCKYGIALFDEPEDGNVFSPNVAYELGIMHYQQKENLILRHSSLPPFPFDLTKELHYEYSDNLEIEDIISTWVKKIVMIENG